MSAVHFLKLDPHHQEHVAVPRAYVGKRPSCSWSLPKCRRGVRVIRRARIAEIRLLGWEVIAIQPQLDALKPCFASIQELNAKYGTSYGLDMVDPESQSVLAVAPEWAFALDSDDFSGSPTRFTFAN